MAAEPGPAGPPPNYRLSDLRLSVAQEPGRGSGGTQQLTLPGSGQATLERAGNKRSFRYPAAELLALVNELHAIRFFQLPTQYDTRISVFLKDDGTVATQLMRPSDAPSTTVCFTLPAFEKCVTYGNDAPPKLNALVQRLWSDADRLAR